MILWRKNRHDSFANGSIAVFVGSFCQGDGDAVLSISGCCALATGEAVRADALAFIETHNACTTIFTSKIDSTVAQRITIVAVLFWYKN